MPTPIAKRLPSFERRHLRDGIRRPVRIVATDCGRTLWDAHATWWEALREFRFWRRNPYIARPADLRLIRR